MSRPLRTRLLGFGALAAAAIAVVVLLAAGSDDATVEGAGPADAAEEIQVDTSQWPNTDFSKHSVPLSEFVSGGPPRDGIPPIDDPKTVSQDEAEEWLSDEEPVLVVEVGDAVRGYPIQVLIWHEIANDVLGGRPIAVTYCPLCNSSVVFDRRVNGQEVTFGTTGNLRKSDLVMWDRQTESWWQQLTARAVVGEMTGTELEVLPSQTLSWEDFRRAHPNGDVLSRDTGVDRPYGDNPYELYDNPDSQPFLLDEQVDERLPAKERVAAAFTDQEKPVVAPFSTLVEKPVINTESDDVPVVFFYKPGVVSPLDARAISESRDVGTAGVFDRRLSGQTLEFEPAGEGRFRDLQTGSTWDITGRAVAGELEGQRLEQIRHDEQFWFAVAAFIPDAKILR